MTLHHLQEKLSPHERAILPHLKNSLDEIKKETNLEEVAILRALEYLQNKKILAIQKKTSTEIILGVNGIRYQKKGLPERTLLEAIAKKGLCSFDEAKKETGLSEEEFKAALGALKKNALIEITNGKIKNNSDPKERGKLSLEELFLQIVPLKKEECTPEQLFGYDKLRKRKDIVEEKEIQEVRWELSKIGEELLAQKPDKTERIEQITSEILQSEKNWKGKKFRHYDVESPVPLSTGGRRHFVNQALDYARTIWIEMGFREMEGTMVQSSFWNFDALFTAQDHPVRELQDTFYLEEESTLPKKELVETVRKTHEEGIGGSRGWRYTWQKENAQTTVLRTHTTCLSAQTIHALKKEDLPQKFFALGKNFRNETVDWSHGFEFYQTEGIVIDKEANFTHLLGYLKQFYKKMGFDNIRFRPAYFPYTEPSVEIDVWHPEKKTWLELGGAGMFRPEITIPLFGEKIPVLAWGQGFDRIIMDYFKIKDLRELYKNDIKQLRTMPYWMK